MPKIVLKYRLISIETKLALIISSFKYLARIRQIITSKNASLIYYSIELDIVISY
jgi:hypothetical protein